MAATAPPPTRLRVALIAHDGMKDKMVEFATANFDALAAFELVGTGTTGGRVTEATGLAVQRYLSGPLGGDAQLAALVATLQLQAVIFFVDPLNAHPHEPDIQGLLRVCNVHNCPVATNPATAALLLRSLTRA